ncbi:MAG: AMP-binding protein [Pseudomonadota bacterium]
MANMTDYQATYAAFHWQRRERFNFAGDVIDTAASHTPDKQALLWVDDAGREISRSFSDIALASRRLASALADKGVKRGDVVLLLLGREIAWWESLTACLRAGIIVAPGTTQLTPKDIAYRLEAAKAVAVITNSAHAAKVDAAARESGPLRLKICTDGAPEGWTAYEALLAAGGDDFAAADTRVEEEALYYFTSGTTGFPKMAVHGHGYGLGHETTGRYWLDLGPHDLHWNISDTGWAKAAWSSYFAPWLQGAAVFVHNSAAFNAQRSLQLLARYPITTLCAAPTVYRMLVLEDLSAYGFPRLRHCVGAGEPLNPEVIAKWRRATGLAIRDGYGQTETVLLCGNFPTLAVKPGSMGKPAPGIELAVIDEKGEPLAANQEGDIAVKARPVPPAGLFLGYKDDAERTAACFRGDWYLTGDRALVDGDGYFWFVSRADDVILSAGYRIGPFEVESALLSHPAVAESAVVSSPDETRGEVVKAFIVLAPGHAPSDALARALQDHVKSVTAPYKYPRKIAFIDNLPKTVSGKIRRVTLREKEWGGRR